MPDSPAKTTNNRIFLAAEELFARKGFDGVSLREITTTAKVNLAAVNYHYFDKESLYLQILTHRLRQIRQQRLALLQTATPSDVEGLIPLQAIANALARPGFLPTPETSPTASRLLGRMLAERHPCTNQLIETEFQPGLRPFSQALRRHAMTLSPERFLWQFNFAIGALHQAMATRHEMNFLTGGVCRNDDGDMALESYTSLICQIFRTTS